MVLLTFFRQPHDVTLFIDGGSKQAWRLFGDSVLFCLSDEVFVLQAALCWPRSARAMTLLPVGCVCNITRFLMLSPPSRDAS